MSPNSGNGNILSPDEVPEEGIIVGLGLDEIDVTLALVQLQPEEPFTTLAEDKLPHQLDSIAWNHRHALFAFASYEIHPTDTGRRVGNVYLATLSDRDRSEVGYTILQTLSGLPGVLDIKWEPSNEKSLVAATSESLIIYSLETGQGPFLAKVSFLKTDPDMALYVSWLNSTDIIYSDSAGNVVTWNRGKDKEGGKGESGKVLKAEGSFGEEGDPSEEGTVTSSPLHKYFVWFVHFDTEEQLVYSGDDCGYFRGFHLKDLTNPSVHAKHQFQTGVTSILTKRDLVLVGCYDDHLRVFTRTVDNGTVKLSRGPLLDVDVGGTVWRTMWVPPLSVFPNMDGEEELKVAVAAGRNGIHVISINPADWSWETTFRCLEHKGFLAYGLDIHPNTEEVTYTLATVYFDSHTLHIFTLKP